MSQLNASSMKLTYSAGIALFILFIITSVSTVVASHIRAGEITAEVTDVIARSYRFTFIGYRDTDTGVRFGGGVFDLGDGNTETNFILTETQITPNIVRTEFVVNHSYNAPGSYTVSYREEFRNNDIANMANSSNTAFYVETVIRIDPIYGLNRSPVLTVPPIDDGLVGVKFLHNAGAFDPDGDSLSYRLVIPKQSRTAEVPRYRSPSDVFFYGENFGIGNEDRDGEPTFVIDPLSGDLTWDAPGEFLNLSGRDCPEGAENCAEYNVAFVVEEWRNRFGRPEFLGSVTRDMQIIITDGMNERPELIVPEEICVEAGTTVEGTATGTDPDGHQVRLEAFGGPFEVISPAQVAPDPARFQDSPATLDFTWETVCGHVRLQPYDVQFKVTDNPVEAGIRVGPSLAEFATWEITVVGPAPEGLALTASGSRDVSLEWSDYACPNASEIQVWRRVGEFMFEADNCMVGIPPNSGYQLVETVGMDTTQFLDEGLAAGANYCYRLVAIFPAPGGGASYASREVCITLEVDAPVITHVDVAQTSTDGEVIVRWTPPYDLDPDQVPPPYRYNLFRSNDLNFASPGTQIATAISDTVFIDRGINTVQRGFSYQVELVDEDGDFIEASAEASSVRLDIDSEVNGIRLNWTSVVPWSNQMDRYPYHYIYRDNVTDDADELVLIDSVQVSRAGFRYFDDGTFNAEDLRESVEYCYYATTVGAYDNRPLIEEPLINRSQTICAEIRDVIPPCPPRALTLSGEDCAELVALQSCDLDDFQNDLSWEGDTGPNCDDDVESYNIYFSSTGLEQDFQLIANTVDNFFAHTGLPGFKGCYRISSVDRSGNESDLSAPSCADNCPNYAFPNVFTPNGDGINDVFMPLFSEPDDPIQDFDSGDCPRFVREVLFTVFDRTGKPVFNYNSTNSESGILIKWNGKANDGRDLPSGVYYYRSDVEFDVLQEANSSRELVGWVQLLR